MHLPSLLVALGVCGAIAAPLEQQQPLAGSARHHGGPHKVENPYKPGNEDPFDKKIDSQGDKLQPLPYVSILVLRHVDHVDCFPPSPNSKQDISNGLQTNNIIAKWRRRNRYGPSQQSP
jgi:hypothetical protein